MRQAVVVVVLVVACAPDESGQVAALQAKVDQQAQLAQQQQATIDALSHEVMALMQSGAGKVPHLVVAATGEDLGPYLGADCAWNADAGGEACFHVADIAFDRPDCTGNAALLDTDTKRPSERYGYVDGNWWSPTGPVAAFTMESFIGFGGCNNSSQPVDQMAIPLRDTGIPSRQFDMSALRVELR